MKFRRLNCFKKFYKSLPETIPQKTDKALTLLFSNPKHPSLQVKKLEGIHNIWYLRVDRQYRLTFQIEKEFYIIRHVGLHDIIDNP